MGRRAVVGALAAGAVFASPAWAGTLDQSQTDTAGGGFTVSSRFTPAQTFTARRNGQVLDRINVWATKIDGSGCQPPGDLAVQIRRVTPGGLPTGTVLAEKRIDPSRVPLDLGTSPTPTPPVATRFASPPGVAAGSQYAIVLRETGSADSGCYRWYSSNVDVYPRGIAFGGDEGTFTVAQPPTDLAFQTFGSGTCEGKTATVTGTQGRDQLEGTRGRDIISGLGGRDKISGLRGNDVICGGKGKDKLMGSKGADRLNGGGAKDKCSGGPGRDVLKKCELERSV